VITWFLEQSESIFQLFHWRNKNILKQVISKYVDFRPSETFCVYQFGTLLYHRSLETDVVFYVYAWHVVFLHLVQTLLNEETNLVVVGTEVLSPQLSDLMLRVAKPKFD